MATNDTKAETAEGTIARLTRENELLQLAVANFVKRLSPNEMDRLAHNTRHHGRPWRLRRLCDRLRCPRRRG